MKKFGTKKQLVEVDVPVLEVSEGEEFVDAIGETVALFGMVYIYSGKLVGVNDSHVVLEDAKIVYETGAYTNSDWKDAQKLPTKELKVRKGAVESWFVVNR